MRRIVIGIPRDQKIFPNIERLANIEYLWMVHTLRSDDQGYACIWRVRSPDPISKWKRAKIAGVKKLEILSQDSDGSYFIYAESNLRFGLERFFENVKGGFPFPAFEMTPESVKISFLGSVGGIKSFLARLDRARVPYEVLSHGNAKFSRADTLLGMTALQRKALTEAHSKGYFDVPRRITSSTLADRLGIDQSTLSEHIRKAEKRIIDDLLA